MKPYEVRLEISGPTAMWTRPDAGDVARSRPAPIFSAAKGSFEPIVRLKLAAVMLNQRLKICLPFLWHSDTPHYGGPLHDSR